MKNKIGLIVKQELLIRSNITLRRSLRSARRSKVTFASSFLLELRMDAELVSMALIETAKGLMLDEFEILHWVKHIERFDFKETNFALDILFIGLATKLLLNDQKTKEPIEVYLTKINNQFYFFN